MIPPAPPVPAGASAAAPSAPASGEPRGTAIPAEPIETACNGTDDDGDGVVDLLLPLAPNACDAPLPGACAHGFAACEGGQKVCLTPAPMPEVVDGVDNDCNGQIDDVPSVSVHPRALVIAPRYAWTDAAPDIATVVSALAQAGIPYDLQAPGTDWSSEMPKLDDYALAIVPGYLIGAVVHFGISGALESFARRGGVVLVFKPIGTADEPQAWKLTGLRGSKRRRDMLEVRFDGARVPAVSDVDSPEERRLPINERGAADPVEAYLLDPDPAAGTQVVAHARGPGGEGATITRRPLGQGAVYALGHDLYTFGGSHCYVNCFEPSGDVLRLLLEGALREGSMGHVVLKHTVPGEQDSVLVLTHDIDAEDAYREGPWGPPGALQAAELERTLGVRATYNITTDYVTGYYHEPTVRALCAMGMCPLGAHSVTHPLGFAKLPLGTCTETVATYGKQTTLCGEIRVSRDLVAQATGRAPRVWRSPYLALPPQLFDQLVKNGFVYDSGFGIGDLPYNLPVDMATVGFHQDRFRHAPLLEFPIGCEDGIGEVHDGVQQRTEIQQSNQRRFGSLWRYELLRNAQNRSFTTLLLHPSTGRDMPAENLHLKIEALGRLIEQAKAAGVSALPLEDVGDFWRARLEATLDAHYDAAGYAGTLTLGAHTAPGLTLEFGDTIGSFSCPSCGPVGVHGKRVVIRDPPQPRAKLAFIARVK